MSSLNWGRTTQKIGRRVLKNLWHSFRRRDCIVGNPPAGVIMCPTVNTSKCNMKTETIGAGRACSLYIRSEHPVSVFRLFAIFFFFLPHSLFGFFFVLQTSVCLLHFHWMVEMVLWWDKCINRTTNPNKLAAVTQRRRVAVDSPGRSRVAGVSKRPGSRSWQKRGSPGSEWRVATVEPPAGRPCVWAGWKHLQS